MAAPGSWRSWRFDVSALIVLLVGESVEQRYRVVGRSLAEALVTAPVTSAQAYLASYDFLLHHSPLMYFSPTGMKWAPLRNMKLDNAISKMGLLEDGRLTRFSLVAVSGNTPQPVPRARRNIVLTWLWATCTWVSFAGVIAFCVYAPDTTWVGLVTCTVFCGWSAILRIVEYAVIVPSSHPRTADAGDDAVFILGRDNSGLLLQGPREDIKRWTSSGPKYRDMSGATRRVCETFTRIGTLLVLLLIFAAIPNGSTTDQLAFVILGFMGQINTRIGIWLNAACCLDTLGLKLEETTRERTEVYAVLIRHFSHIDQAWIDKSGILPDTPVWRRWRAEILLPENRDKDAKLFYNAIEEEERKKKRQ